MNTTEPPTLDDLATPLETYIGKSYRWRAHPRTPILKVTGLQGIGALTDVILADPEGEFRRQIPATMFRSELALRSLQPIDESAPTNTAPDGEKPAHVAQQGTLPGLNDNLLVLESDGPPLGSVERFSELPPLGTRLRLLRPLSFHLAGTELEVIEHFPDTGDGNGPAFGVDRTNRGAPIAVWLSEFQGGAFEVTETINLAFTPATDQDFERATAIPRIENFPATAALIVPEAPSVIPAWATERWGDDLFGLVGQALEVRQSGVLIAMTVAGVSQGLGGLRLHRTDNPECRDTTKFETFFSKIERGDILVHAEQPGRDPVQDATMDEILNDPSQPFALTERIIEEMPTIEEIRAVAGTEKPKHKIRKDRRPAEPAPLPQGLDALRAEEAAIVQQIKGLNARLEEVYRLIQDEERYGDLRRKREELIRQLAEVNAEMGVSA